MTMAASTQATGLSQNDLYDRQTVEVMRRVLTRRSNGIDAGAHIGGLLRPMVEMAPDGRHYAFEPIPHMAEKLRKEFPSVAVHELVLADRSSTVTFNYVADNPGYSGLEQRHYPWENPDIRKLTVKVETLDIIIPLAERIDFIKLNIGGGEYHAMLGGIETIRRCRPVIVFEAAKGSTGHYGVGPNDMFDLVTHRLGMNISTIDRWLHGDAAYTAQAFERNWWRGTENFFIAWPAGRDEEPPGRTSCPPTIPAHDGC